MKTNFLQKVRSASMATLGAMLLFTNVAEAQMVKEFNKRANSKNRTDSIFHIQGDFAMIGNSNLTVTGRNPGNSSSNSNTSMVYNKLSGDPASIINSSSANFSFRSENGSELACTEVLFAGLYWTGRTTEGGTSTPMNWASAVPQPVLVKDTVTNNRNVNSGNSVFSVANSTTLSFPNRTTANSNSTAYYVNSIDNISYTFLRYQLNGYQYEFGISGQTNPTYLLRYRPTPSSDSRRTPDNGWTILTDTQYSISTTPSGIVTANLLVDTLPGLTATATTTQGPTNRVTTVSEERSIVKSFTRSNATFTTHAGKDNHRDGTNGVARAYITVENRVISSVTTTYATAVSLSKNQIKLKGPGDIYYTQHTTTNDNIYYPSQTGTHGGIYTGFLDVTDFVKARGEGTYSVADIATSTGDGGSIGFFGGWSLVVVYENYKMEWRDISIFDGHGFIEAGANNTPTAHILPIKGFKARQNGPVNIKMGIMAGEGDRSISGDFFKMYNKDSLAYEHLKHSSNDTTNFFNSSINLGSGVTRVPNYSNNTGIDIAVFNLNNDDFQYVSNGDDSTSFEFGSNQDTYTIPLIVFGVDAYVPYIAPINKVTHINGNPYNPVMDVILPGDTITYELLVKNTGAEDIVDAEFNIVMPFYADFHSMDTVYYHTTLNATLAYDANLGDNGAIVWSNIDTIPKPLPNENENFAKLTYKLIATKDCYKLANATCSRKVSVDGTASGIGAVSKEVIENVPFIRGFVIDGTCQGAAINTPTVLGINGAQFVRDNCGTNALYLNFVSCQETSTGTVPLSSEITENFPAGSKFYNSSNLNQEYTVATGLPFNTNVASITYTVLPPATSNDCSYEFKISAFEKPQVVGLSQDCDAGEIIISATPSDLTYAITAIHNNPRFPIAIPLPPSNNTGIFNGLVGVDSVEVVINNDPACALTGTLIFDECIQQLPVDFVSFDAAKNKSVVDLNWKVANEINVEKYIVQRSTNAVDFENVVTVNATEKSNEVKTYTSTDFKPAAGINYYRIKQVDFDGTFGYSVVRMVEFDQANTNAKLYPIPAQSTITLEIDAPSGGNIEYWTLNSAAQMNGAKLYQTITKGNNKITVDIAHYADGLYVLAYKLNNDDQVYYLKFSKNMGK